MACQKIYNFLNLFEKNKFNFKDLKDGFSFGLPLILSGLAFWGLTSIDKLMIKDLSSLNELALYSVAVSFASAVVIIRSVFSTIWAPAIYKNEDHPDIEKNIRSVVSLMGVVIFYLFCIVGIFSPLVAIILPDNYELVSSIIICCVGYPLFYTMSEATSMGINVKKKTYYSMLVSILTLGVNFVSILLITIMLFLLMMYVRTSDNYGEYNIGSNSVKFLSSFIKSINGAKLVFSLPR